MPMSSSRAQATWLTVPEAAEYLAVSIDTVRRYIAAGRVEALRVGPRLLRVNRESLESMGERLGGADR